MPEVTAERLRELLHYDPGSGLFTWRGPRRGRGARHKHAGGLREGGYVVIGIDGRIYRAHRLAWLYVHGVWPTHGLDHKDGVASNNAIANLRDVPAALNAQNMKLPSGIEHRPENRRPYRARLWVDGKLRTVGSFFTEAEAIHARLAAKAEWHPGFVPDSSRQLP